VARQGAETRAELARPLCPLSEGRELDLKPVFKFQGDSVLLLHIQEDFCEPLGLVPALFIGYNALCALKQAALLEAAEFPVAG